MEKKRGSYRKNWIQKVKERKEEARRESGFFEKESKKKNERKAITFRSNEVFSREKRPKKQK